MGVKYYETDEPAPKQPKSVNVEEGIRSSDDDDIPAVGEDGAIQEEAKESEQAAAKEIHFEPKKSAKTEEEVEATEHRFGYSDVDIDLYSVKVEAESKK